MLNMRKCRWIPTGRYLHTAENKSSSISGLHNILKSDPLQKGELVILHGLFGAKQNWKSLTKAWKTQQLDAVALDLRNHGDSPWFQSHDYPSMSDDLHRWMNFHSLKTCSLLGHSMGGKVAMHYALEYPSNVDKLVVVDMAPVNSVSPGHASLFDFYCAQMIRIQEAKLKSKTEADHLLQSSIPEPAIRQFLLTNFKKEPGQDHLTCRVNLSVIATHLSEIWKFPFHDSNRVFDKPTLFIGGSRADYIKPEHHRLIHKFFPKARIEYLDTGHWVHAEKPKEFLKLVTEFVKKSAS